MLGDPVSGIDPEGLSVYNKLWILTKNRWNHIYNRHISLHRFTNKSKWLFSKRDMIEKYIDITVKNPDISTPQENGKILYEKLFDKVIGTKGERWVRVVLDKENKIVTAFPAKNCKPKIVDKPLESGIGPIDTIISFIIGELFFNQD